MIQHLTRVLLAVSLVFNAMFIGGYLHARARADLIENEDSRSRLVADELQLDDEQLSTLRDLRAEASRQVALTRQRIFLARQDLWSEINSPSPDPDRISSAEERLAELYREISRLGLTGFRTFMETLRPEQRHAVIDRIRTRGMLHPRARRLLRRFDADGNGILDETERAKAREALVHPPPPPPGRGMFGTPNGAPRRRGARRQTMPRDNQQE